MSYRYTCEICSREIEGDDKDGVVVAAKHHLKDGHSLQKEDDVSQPNIAYEDEQLRGRIEEID